MSIKNLLEDGSLGDRLASMLMDEHQKYLDMNLIRKIHHFALLTLGMLSSLAILSQESSALRIAPLGNTVELELSTATDEEYILETQAQLMVGEKWAPLMQFRGNAAQPKRFVDPICGDKDAKFFRLRKLLEAPRPEVSNFRLLDLDGKAHELYYNWPAKGIVVFLAGSNSELISASSESLIQLQSNVEPGQLLTWVVLLSDPEDRESLQEAWNNLPESLPVLQDTTQAVTRTLSSGEVPEAILINPADWSIAYRGPVDLTIDTGVGLETTHPLKDAVEELFAGQSPVVSKLAPFGVTTGTAHVEEATYSSHIVPILKEHCFPCHTTGNIAPWSMTSYDVIDEFSGLIKSAVLAGEMPPWHADPKYSAFANAKSMLAEEVSMLVDWIDRGSPRGDGPDGLAEDPMPEPTDWPLGQPDAIISIPPQSVPAQGVVDYLYLFADSPFPNDVWLKAVSVNPGDRSVVHHCLVFKGGFSELLDLRGGLGGFFAGYVPGMEPVVFPEGTGKRLRKSDLIVFQMHYTISGKATTDRTQLGLYLSDAPPEKELITSAAYETDFRIPRNSRDVYVKATRSFPRASTIYEFSPHMHYRGASAKFTFQYPNGTSETVLSVPAYFFDWQALYRFDIPKQIPAGTTLLCEGWFDNTSQNRFNPNPNDIVRFGEQSWEEMFIGYVNFSED